MLNKSELVKNLKEELSCLHKDFTIDEVYNGFEKFVKDKAGLRSTIEMGILQYDYVKYKTLFQGTLFEDGIKLIIHMCNEANTSNPLEFKQILLEYYPKIAKGLENQTQLCWLEGNDFDIQRNDLAVKKSFRFLGDLIENLFKPYALFLNKVRALVQGKKANQKKLGMVVNVLINYQDVFRGLYKDLLLDISISQWRNIADHGSFESTESGVEVIYGENDEFNKLISMPDLELLFCMLDTLLYMHKTAYTLLSIDYVDILEDVFLYSKSKEETWNDNLVSQMVETSYAYDFELKKIDKESDIWVVVVESDREQEQQCLMKYCSIIAKLLENYRMIIYRYNKVEYVAQCMNRRLEVLKYKI